MVQNLKYEGKTQLACEDPEYLILLSTYNHYQVNEKHTITPPHLIDFLDIFTQGLIGFIID